MLFRSYVFDGNDPPPADLEGTVICARESLTIYQAWNLALGLVSTPLVMNLNLDDRLAPDAVQTLQDLMQQEKAIAAGGDWKICYSQADTDAVVPCYPAAEVAVVREWPPAVGTLGRLGSSTGERGLGPAVMWRMDAHLGAPRYPWRFSDGTPIRVVADLAWWGVLKEHLRGKILRVPKIVGNYYSHPGEQAEFRTSPNQELVTLQRIGISLL